jgi:hypothetical protein
MVSALPCRPIQCEFRDLLAVVAQKIAAHGLALRLESICPSGDSARAMPSQPISTRAASRHRMAANGFRCRFVASAIVSAYDRRGVVLPGVKVFPPGREHHPPHTVCEIFTAAGRGFRKANFDGAQVTRSGTIKRSEYA